MFVVISQEKNVVIMFIFGTVIRYHVLLMLASGSVSNLSNYGHFFMHLCICCDISEKSGLILFIFGILIRYHMLLRQI